MPSRSSPNAASQILVASRTGPSALPWKPSLTKGGAALHHVRRANASLRVHLRRRRCLAALVPPSGTPLPDALFYTLRDDELRIETERRWRNERKVTSSAGTPI